MCRQLLMSTKKGKSLHNDKPMPLYPVCQIYAGPFFAAFIGHIVGIGPWVAYNNGLDDRSVISLSIGTSCDHYRMPRTGARLVADQYRPGFCQLLNKIGRIGRPLVKHSAHNVLPAHIVNTP